MTTAERLPTEKATHNGTKDQMKDTKVNRFTQPKRRLLRHRKHADITFQGRSQFTKKNPSHSLSEHEVHLIVMFIIQRVAHARLKYAHYNLNQSPTIYTRGGLQFPPDVMI